MQKELNTVNYQIIKSLKFSNPQLTTNNINPNF